MSLVTSTPTNQTAELSLDNLKWPGNLEFVKQDKPQEPIIICIVLSGLFELVVLFFATPQFPDFPSAAIAAVFAVCAFTIEFRGRKRSSVLILLGLFALFCCLEVWRQKLWYDALPPGYNLKWESYKRLFR